MGACVSLRSKHPRTVPSQIAPATTPSQHSQHSQHSTLSDSFTGGRVILHDAQDSPQQIRPHSASAQRGDLSITTDPEIHHSHQARILLVSSPSPPSHPSHAAFATPVFASEAVLPIKREDSSLTDPFKIHAEEPTQVSQSTGSLLRPLQLSDPSPIIRIYISLADPGLTDESQILAKAVIPQLLRWADSYHCPKDIRPSSQQQNQKQQNQQQQQQPRSNRPRISIAFVADEDTEMAIRLATANRSLMTFASQPESLADITLLSRVQSLSSSGTVPITSPAISERRPMSPPIAANSVVSWPTNPFFTRVFGSKVLRSLRLVEQCQYFVSIMGSRYGSVPSLNDPETWTDQIHVEYPWMLDYGEMSQPEMEIRLASMIAVPACNRGFFYLKEKGNGDADYYSSPESRQKQHGLRNLIHSKFGCSEYSHANDLAVKIVQDITSRLEEDLAVLEKRISFGHRIAERILGMDTRNNDSTQDNLLSDFSQVVDMTNQPVILYGPPGSGKSRLLANYYFQSQEQGDTNIYYFSTQRHPENQYQQIMLKQLCKQLWATIVQRESLNSSYVWGIQEDTSIFFRYLLMLQTQLTFSLFLIDDLADVIHSQSDSATSLATTGIAHQPETTPFSSSLNSTSSEWTSWVPWNAIKSTKIVLATSDPHHLNLAKSRGWAVFEMPGLSEGECSNLLSKLDPGIEYGPDMIAQIHNTSRGNPLYLQVFVIGCQMLQGTVSDRVSLLLRAKDLRDLVDCVLQLMLVQYESVALGFLRFLSHSSNGLDEAELVRLLDIPSSIYYAFLKKFRVIYQSHGPWVRFSHPFIRSVALDILSKRANGSPVGGDYIAHLLYRVSDIPTGRQRARLYYEVTCHYLKQNPSKVLTTLFQRDYIETFVFDPDLFALIVEQLSHHAPDALVQLQEGIETHWNVNLCERLIEVYVVHGRLKTATTLAEAHLLKVRERLSEDQACVSRACHLVASIYRMVGRFRPALSLALEALHIHEGAAMQRTWTFACTLVLLGRLQVDLGQYGRALDSLRQSLVIRESLLPSMHPDVAESFEAISRCCLEMEDLSSAITHAEKAMAIWSELYHPGHPLVLAASTIQLCARRLLGIKQDIMPLFQRLKKSDWTFYRSHKLYCILHICRALRNQGKLSEVVEIAHDALEDYRSYYWEDHPHILLLEAEMKIALFGLQPDTSIGDVVMSISTRLSRVLGHIHPHSGILLCEIARIKHTLGNADEALQLATSGISILEESHGHSSSIVTTQKRWSMSIAESTIRPQSRS